MDEYGFGVVLGDHERNVLAAKSTTKQGILEPIAAEALATLHAAEFSCDMEAGATENHIGRKYGADCECCK